jgi:uncharacterized membrane-anchored protein
MMKKQLYKVTTLCDEKITNLLKNCDHKLTARWALDAASHVLYLFEEKNSKDLRPRQALNALKLWMDGKISMTDARTYALAAHRAAKNETNPEAIAAARTCAHACAVAHVKTHANGVMMYAILASMYANGGDQATETNWQYNHLIELMNVKS